MNVRAFNLHLRTISTYSLLLVCVVFALFPIAWMFSSSLKNLMDAFRIPPSWIPNPTTFARQLWNSIVVSAATTITACILAIMAGYGFSRFRFRGHGLLMRFVLLC